MTFKKLSTLSCWVFWFSSRLAEYTNPEIEVQGKKVLNESYTIVNSLLIGTSDRPEVKIDWRIYTKNPDNPLIEI